MRRIGILTAGGDTPALNAAIHGAVVRANQLKIEVYGLIKGFNCLFNPRVPHVHLNPLFQEIPELDPDQGRHAHRLLARLRRPGAEGRAGPHLVTPQGARHRRTDCVGGDGTLNGLQPLTERLPTVLAPKTIDNDLGLNYPSEPDEWARAKDPQAAGGYRYTRTASSAVFDLDHIVNYVTPGYATAVLVSAQGVERIRTTAESHRRIAIIEVMGRHSGYIALGTAYGQPDIILRARASARHRAARRARPAPLRPAEERRHRLRRGHRRRAGRRARRRVDVDRPGRQRRLERRGRGAAREDDPDARRRLLPALPARQHGAGSDLHQKGRPHPARRPADPVRPLLRGAPRLGGGRSAGRGAQQRRVGAPVQRRARAFTSKATTPIAFATAGA